MAIIPVTATIEALLAECVGDAPELVQLQDWRTIALRLSRRLEEVGLRITKHARSLDERVQMVGPLRPGDVALVVADGSHVAITASEGMPMSQFAPHMQERLWRDMLDLAVRDLAAARRGEIS